MLEDQMVVLFSAIIVSMWFGSHIGRLFSLREIRKISMERDRLLDLLDGADVDLAGENPAATTRTAAKKAAGALHTRLAAE